MISMSLFLALITFITRRIFVTSYLTAYCVCKPGLFQSMSIGHIIQNQLLFPYSFSSHYVSVNTTSQVLCCLKTSDEFNFSFALKLSTSVVALR